MGRIELFIVFVLGIPVVAVIAAVIIASSRQDNGSGQVNSSTHPYITGGAPQGDPWGQQVAPVTSQQVASPVDLRATLQNRLATGEISIEQYDEMLARLV